MFKTTAVIGLTTAVISFVAVPAYADGVFSTSNLRIGDVNLSISSDGKVLTKADANTGQQRGQQNFKEFYGMMWEPSNSVLFVSGILEGSNQPVLVKIRSTGGGGNNMFALTSDGGSAPGYNYRLGSQLMTVRRMSYNGNLQIDNGSGVLYQIKGVGGTGNNMFALANNTACQTAPGYNYFMSCSSVEATNPTASFPIAGDRDDAVSNGRMSTSFTLASNGQLTAVTNTRTGVRLAGFTGAVSIILLDGNRQPIWTSDTQSYGVDGCILGRCNRNDNWSANVPADITGRVRGYAILHQHNPTWLGRVGARGDQFLRWLGSDEGQGTIGAIAAIAVML